MSEETAYAIKNILVEHLVGELAAIKTKMNAIDLAEVGESITVATPATNSYYFDQQKLFASGDFPAAAIVPGKRSAIDNVGGLSIVFQVEWYAIDDFDYVSRVIRRLGRATWNILKRHRTLDGAVKRLAMDSDEPYPGKLPSDGGSLLRAQVVSFSVLKADTEGAAAETV